MILWLHDTGEAYTIDIYLIKEQALKKSNKYDKIYFKEVVKYYKSLFSFSLWENVKERVRFRVSIGGNGITDEDIERRYYDLLNNLKEIIEICDEINIYDNTEMFREIIDFQNGKSIWKDKKL